MRCPECNGILTPTFPPNQRCRCEPRTSVPDAGAEPAPSNTPGDPPPDKPAPDLPSPDSLESADPFETSGVGYPD